MSEAPPGTRKSSQEGPTEWQSQYQNRKPDTQGKPKRERKNKISTHERKRERDKMEERGPGAKEWDIVRYRERENLERERN
jgi:hypothetical protein